MNLLCRKKKTHSFLDELLKGSRSHSLVITTITHCQPYGLTVALFIQVNNKNTICF